MLGINLIGQIIKSVCLESCMKLFGTAAIVLSALLLLWHFLAPERPEADRPRKNIANRAIIKLVEDLRRERGEIKEVAVMHFKNDGSDYVTDSLRDKLATSGVFEVSEPGFLEKIGSVLKLRNKGAFSTKEAVKYGRSFEVQAVITGNLERFESMKNGAVIKGTVRIISIPEGKIIAEIPVNENSAGSIFTIEERSDLVKPGTTVKVNYPWHIRFLIFVMVVLLLPVLSISFIRYMVAKRSNGCNAFVLGIYTFIDLILAGFMTGGFTTVLSTVIFLGASVAAFIYNASVMSFALKLES